MVRKSKLQDAAWNEVDFENAVWTIPEERMKRSKAHNVYSSFANLESAIALIPSALFGLVRWDAADRLEKSTAVEPVDPFERHKNDWFQFRAGGFLLPFRAR